jgi:hypothetical protein
VLARSGSQIAVHRRRRVAGGLCRGTQGGLIADRAARIRLAGLDMLTTHQNSIVPTLGFASGRVDQIPKIAFLKPNQAEKKLSTSALNPRATSAAAS